MTALTIDAGVGVRAVVPSSTFELKGMWLLERRWGHLPTWHRFVCLLC